MSASYQKKEKWQSDNGTCQASLYKIHCLYWYKAAIQQRIKILKPIFKNTDVFPQELWKDKFFKFSVISSDKLIFHNSHFYSHSYIA